jgi:hypothetical protein
MTERKKILLRLDPAVHDAVAHWAADELRSTNSQIEFLLRRALTEAGRMPTNAARPARRGRPRKRTEEEEPDASTETHTDGADDGADSGADGGEGGAD